MQRRMTRVRGARSAPTLDDLRQRTNSTAHAFVARPSAQLWVACAQDTRSALALLVLAPDAIRRARCERGNVVAPTTSPYKHLSHSVSPVTFRNVCGGGFADDGALPQVALPQIQHL